MIVSVCNQILWYEYILQKALHIAGEIRRNVNFLHLKVNRTRRNGAFFLL